ncbi:hypothetical protein KIN20_031093 [Parelaphostrongylus tenuis]|uniref:Alpha-2-macroglobulin RAP C-terminal domain-containing protein n=1 Tax=Parelaphostrongylus tenuis TaxID=148309 RepID=A0AAD5WGL8_PARTN|nr:hypothetical protein KIN20_031093 [Parelaphostrongylus tenuis]
MLIKWLQLCIIVFLELSPLLSYSFRSEKINYIYEKALQHIADRKRLQKLEGELSSYDKIYMDTKALPKYRGAHELSSQMEKIDRKLATLLEKYNLQEVIYAFKEKMKRKNDDFIIASSKRSPELDHRFSDERLQQLWEMAHDGKFSENELIAFKNELMDAERKTRIYNDALEAMNKVPIENSIHFDDHHYVDIKKSHLKKAYRDMSDHIDRLHQKIKEENVMPFEHERVKRLWKAALANGNFSQHDLELLKEELHHFDNQLKKIAFHKNELDARRLQREKQGKTTLHVIEDVELEARHEKMERKLRKIEKYLDSKTRLHSEL